MRSVGAVVLAGGTADRFGDPVPKQFHKLAGEPLVVRTVRTVLAAFNFDAIVVVTPVADVDFARRLVDDAGAPLPPFTSFVAGGPTRHDSSYLGLAALPRAVEVVLIHDAARPFASAASIKACIAAVKEGWDAAQAVIPTPDTIVRVNSQGGIEAIPARSSLRRGGTPQAFVRSLLLAAHQKRPAGAPTVRTEDCGVLLDAFPESRIKAVPGNPENIKITTALDLRMAECLLGMSATSAFVAQAEDSTAQSRT